MKKSFTKRILVVLVIMVMASGAIFAAETATVTINGTVGAVISLAVDNTTSAQAIDSDTGLAKVSIATGTYYTNNLAGYTITAASTNAALKETTDANLIPYTVYLNGSAAGVLASTLSGGAFIDVAAPTTSSETFDISISVADEAALWAAGTYQDVLTFVIANK